MNYKMPCDAGNITYYFNCIDLKEVNYRMPCDAGNITYYLKCIDLKHVNYRMPLNAEARDRLQKMNYRME